MFQYEAHATLRQWTSSLSATTSELQQAIKDAYLTGAREHAEHLDRIIAQLAQNLETVHTSATDLRAEINGLVRQFRGATTRLDKAAENFDTVLQNTSGSMERAIQNLAQRVNNIDIPPDLISSKLEELVTSLRIDATTLRTSLQATAKLIEDDITEVLTALKNVPQKEDVQQVIKEYLEALRMLLAHSGTLLGQTTEAATHVRDLNAQATEAGRAISGIPASATALMQELQRIQQTTTTEADKVIRAVRTTGEQLTKASTEVVTFIKRRLEERI